MEFIFERFGNISCGRISCEYHDPESPQNCGIEVAEWVTGPVWCQMYLPEQLTAKIEIGDEDDGYAD